MKLSISTAGPADAIELAALHTEVAEDLTRRGFRSNKTSEKGALLAIRSARVLIARRGKSLVGTLNLPTQKPWAIDVSYFTPAENPLYLTGMAVIPPMQRQGIGRRLIKEAVNKPASGPPMPFASTPSTMTPAPADSTPSAASVKSRASCIGRIL